MAEQEAGQAEDQRGWFYYASIGAQAAEPKKPRHDERKDEPDGRPEE